MNDFQLLVYNDLMTLAETNEAFYFQDFELEGKTYRIFNYRLANYTDFLNRNALECRGIMFEVKNNEAIRLAAWPQKKFFNLNENPLVMNLDLSQIDYIEVKADGSLISTYSHNEQLKLKSKGSLSSEHAISAMKWMHLQENNQFLAALNAFVSKYDATVNLEWCSPEHRIVLGYPNAHLTVLNARNMHTGEMIARELLEEYFPNLIERVKCDNPAAFLDTVKGLTGLEGFVIGFKDGLCVKIKCDWYLSLHHAKDSVNNPRRLFESILDEGIDDLRSLFYTDVVAMKIIDEMQVKVDHVYNHMVKIVEDFYAANKTLDRKSYAIKGQECFKGTFYFGLAMNKYLDKPFSYKEFLKGKWKELGFKDISLEEVN